MTGRTPAWKVLDSGKVPTPAPSSAMLTCLNCMREAELPVVGLAIAQIGQGLVFDIGAYAMPKKIQCRQCRHTFELED